MKPRKRRYLWALLTVLSLFSFTPLELSNSNDWGFHAHREINKLAIFTLPSEMFGFYKEHIVFITEHAVDPDKRRYSMKGEAPKHYIDIDHYCKGDSSCKPFDLVPRKWKDAVEKLSLDTLEAYGTSPWNINLMMYKLTEAFKENNKKRILRLSTELGHYIGDAHVPLHTTENYNGQMTGQRGIHGFWESRLPELFDIEYDFFVGKAEYLDSPLASAWETIESSHLALDSVLRFEAELNKEWPSDQKYVYEERGQLLVKTYSEEYSREYSRRLDGQVERRMKKAIITLGSFWFTAWVNAGQPNLDLLLEENSNEEIELEISKENAQPHLPELKKREHDN